MVRIDLLVFGYRKLYVENEKLAECCSLLLRNRISCRISNGGYVLVREKDFLKTKNLLSGRTDLSYSQALGLYGRWLRLNHKTPIILATLFSIMLVMSLSEIVWDLKIEGNETVTSVEIIESLNDAGLGVGVPWSEINKSDVENRFLQQNPNISWININRRGTVAYITLIEKEIVEDDKVIKLGFSNIVAKEDCIIEELTVKRGTPMVKIGDAVRKGDILIAGVIDAEKGIFCYAEGQIIGRVYDKIDVKIQRENDINSLVNKKLYSIDVKIFNFFINIFKLYGNLTTEYDIINNEVKYSIFGKYRLPISINLSYIPEYQLRSSSYTDEELVEIGKQRMDGLLASSLLNADLISIKSEGVLSSESYYLTSDIVFTTDVGEIKEFNIGIK